MELLKDRQNLKVAILYYRVTQSRPSFFFRWNER